MSFTETAPKLPQFMLEPFPRINVAPWLSDNLKAFAKDVEEAISRAEKAREETKAKMERLADDIGLMMADAADMPKVTERRKNRLSLLQADMTARALAEDFFAEAVREAGERLQAVQPGVRPAKIAARRALAEAGFIKCDPDQFPFDSSLDAIVERHAGVIEAHKAIDNARSYRESINDVRRDNVPRLAVVKAELGKLRDSLIAEVALV